MKQTHSLGPWQVAPHFPYHVLSKDGRTLVCVRRSCLPSNPQTYVSEGEAIANAHLVAAGPDLLAALKKLTLYGHRLTGPKRVNFTLAMDQARAAIASATTSTTHHHEKSKTPSPPA